MVKIDELEIYNLSMQIGEDVWGVVSKWDYFSKDTIGKQWIKSTDSIAANISEGFGRYFYKKNKLFCYYSRGSILESQTWLTKAYNRNLVSEEEFKKQISTLKLIHKKLNAYIKVIGRSSVSTMTNDNDK